MKKQLLKVLTALAIISTTSKVHAYSYIFSNHTNKEIGIGMRYYGLGEPRYFRWIPAHQARQFTPGQPTKSATEREIEYRKIGFIGKTFWYVKNPTEAQKQDPKAIAWHEFQITWIPNEAYQLALDLAEAVGAATIEAAKIALEAAIAIETQGASVAMQAAITAAQEGLDTLEGAGAAGAPLARNNKRRPAKNMSMETTPGSKETILKAVQSGIVSDALTKLISAVGKSASRSMMTDRHIDIIEEKGKIQFISLL
jgi:hypothetical protein